MYIGPLLYQDIWPLVEIIDMQRNIKLLKLCRIGEQVGFFVQVIFSL